MSITTPTRAETLVRKGNALQCLEEATVVLHEAKERHTRAINEAREAGCSLRDVGEAAGLSFTAIRDRERG